MIQMLFFSSVYVVVVLDKPFSVQIREMALFYCFIDDSNRKARSKMNNRKIISVIVSVLLIMSLLAGCSGSATAGTAPSTEAPSTAASTEPATEAVTEAPTQPSHYPVTITTYNYDKEEVQVTFNDCPQRVICTNQTQTELLLYFGLDEYIAGTAYLDGAVREDLQAQYDALVANSIDKES